MNMRFLFRRFIATFIDVVIYYSASLLLSYILVTPLVLMHLAPQLDPMPVAPIFIAGAQNQLDVSLIYALIIAPIIFSFAESRREGFTIGKRYLKLKIESEIDSNPLSVVQLIWRHLTKFGLVFIIYKILDTALYQNSVDFVFYRQIIIFLSFVLSGLFVFRGRFLHEIVSRTKVVDTQVTFDKKSRFALGL